MGKVAWLLGKIRGGWLERLCLRLVYRASLKTAIALLEWNYTPLCLGGQKCRFFGEGGIFQCLKPSNSVGFAGQGRLSCLTYLVCR